MKKYLFLLFILGVIGLGVYGEPLHAQEKSTRLVWKGCGISRKAFMAECAEAYEKKPA